MEKSIVELQNYISRMRDCGFSESEAAKLAIMLKNCFGFRGLSDYVWTIEEEKNVDRI